MQFDWTISIAAVCAVLGLVGAVVGAAYGMVRRICNRLDAIDGRGAALEQQMTAHTAETGRRLDEMSRDVREVRSWLLNGLGHGSAPRPPSS